LKEGKKNNLQLIKKKIIFYLGYPTVGVLKLATLGFFFLGYYADVFMIAMQVLLHLFFFWLLN